MAAKKKAAGSQDEIRDAIAAHPTWSDAQIHGLLKGAGVAVVRDDVAETRRAMGAKDTWSKEI